MPWRSDLQCARANAQFRTSAGQEKAPTLRQWEDTYGSLDLRPRKSLSDSTDQAQQSRWSRDAQLNAGKSYQSPRPYTGPWQQQRQRGSLEGTSSYGSSARPASYLAQCQDKAGFSDELEQEVMSIFNLADCNSDGVVTREEWINAFRELDKDKNGCVSRKEWFLKNGTLEMYERISKHFAARLTLGEWQGAFDRLDANGDGKISIKEWLRLAQEGGDTMRSAAATFREPSPSGGSRSSCGPSPSPRCQQSGGKDVASDWLLQAACRERAAGNARSSDMAFQRAVKERKVEAERHPHRGGDISKWLLDTALRLLRESAGGDDSVSKWLIQMAFQNREQQDGGEGDWLLEAAMQEQKFGGNSEASEWLLTLAMQEGSAKNESTSHRPHQLPKEASQAEETETMAKPEAEEKGEGHRRSEGSCFSDMAPSSQRERAGTGESIVSLTSNGTGRRFFELLDGDRTNDVSKEEWESTFDKMVHDSDALSLELFKKAGGTTDLFHYLKEVANCETDSFKKACWMRAYDPLDYDKSGTVDKRELLLFSKAPGLAKLLEGIKVEESTMKAAVKFLTTAGATTTVGIQALDEENKNELLSILKISNVMRIRLNAKLQGQQ